MLLLCSFREQLQQHVRVHAMEAVMACWELEQSLQSLTGTFIWQFESVDNISCWSNEVLGTLIYNLESLLQENLCGAYFFFILIFSNLKLPVISYSTVFYLSKAISAWSRSISSKGKSTWIIHFDSLLEQTIFWCRVKLLKNVRNSFLNILVFMYYLWVISKTVKWYC